MLIFVAVFYLLETEAGCRRTSAKFWWIQEIQGPYWGNSSKYLFSS